MTNRFAIAVVLACLVMAASADCRADDRDWIPDGWFAPIGVNLGTSLHDSDTSGLILGGEASLVYLTDITLLWAGGYVDGFHDFGTGASRFSIGPEVGWMFGGIELGYLTQWFDKRFHHGFRAGVVLTLGLISAYCRWGHLFGLPDESDFAELGVLLKFPFPIER